MTAKNRLYIVHIFRKNYQLSIQHFQLLKKELRYYHKLSYKGYLTNSRSREKALTNFRILFTRIQNNCTMPIMYTSFNMKETCYEAKADGH